MSKLLQEKLLFVAIFGAFAWGIVECLHTGAWHWFGIAWLIAWFNGTFSINIGMHMLFTHRSYQTARWKEVMLAYWSILVGFGFGPIGFAAMHRHHHAHSDTELDPHTPKTRGIWYIISNWWMFKPLVPREQIRVPRDLLRDPVLQNIEKHYYKFWAGLIVLFYLLGGVHAVVWFLLIPAAWDIIITNVAVNALAHESWIPGSYRNFDTRDASINSKLLQWITLGSGYHNNHHHAPNKHNTAMRPGEFDHSGWLIEKLFIKS